MLDDSQDRTAVLFDPLSLWRGTSGELVFEGAVDVEDVRDGPGIVERLHDEEWIADVPDQVLGKHAHVLVLRELRQALRGRRTCLLVAELEESSECIAEGIGLASEVQGINRYA